MSSHYTRLRAQQMIEASASQAIDALLKSWDKELDAAFEAIRKRGAELEQLKHAEAASARRALSEQAADEVLASAVRHHLQSLAIEIEAGHVAPAGCRAASMLLAGPPVGDLSQLIAAVQAETGEELAEEAIHPAQNSIAWALSEGLPPHGHDIATLLGRADTDTAWAKHFSTLARRLEGDGPGFKNPQLQGHTAHGKMDALAEHVHALSTFGTQRLVNLVVDPRRLSGTQAGPVTSPSRTSLSPPAFHAMLDGLFGRKR